MQVWYLFYQQNKLGHDGFLSETWNWALNSALNGFSWPLPQCLEETGHGGVGLYAGPGQGMGSRRAQSGLIYIKQYPWKNTAQDELACMPGDLAGEAGLQGSVIWMLPDLVQLQCSNQSVADVPGPNAMQNTVAECTVWCY